MARRDPWLFVGLLAFFALVFLAVFGERMAPHEAIYFVPEHGSDPRPYDPGLVFPFGSDVLGRDLFSVVLAGARATLTIVVLSGAARVVAGALVAAVSSWWRPTRIATESLAELASAIPATLVALVLVKVFLKTDPSIVLVTGALLVTGWAGPYRVIRAEVDRLRAMSFTQGAVAIGVGRWRLFWRHHLPHLAPVLAVNLSQQVVASLVLVAELGVLSVFVGATRFINLEESLTRAAIREVPFAQIADPPEWGGLLANARTIESLWTTRWLFLIPGVAFAVSAIAVAMIGFALARRYARWDVTQDVRSRGVATLAVALLAILVASTLVPERYAAAREWAAAARAEVRSAGQIESAFADAGLKPIGGSYAVQRDVGGVVQIGPATVSVGGATVAQVWPRKAPRFPDLIHVQSFVTASTGGGVVEAPLVFVGRGTSPSEHPPAPPSPPYVGKLPDLGMLIKDYADDYAAVDVRGKVVVLLRFVGVAAAKPPALTSNQSILNGSTLGFPVDESIASAIKHGAAAVIFVDNDLTNYTDRIDQSSGGRVGGVNPYLPLQAQHPPVSTSGVPVVVLDTVAASTLLAPTGLDITDYFQVRASLLDLFDAYMGQQYRQSPARELGQTARVEVPLARERALVTSYVGEVADAPDDRGRVLIWSARGANGADAPTRDVIAALARALADRRVPLVFVDFDPAVTPRANANAIVEALKDRRIALVVVLDQLSGSALRFTTANGELIPALDLYADKAAARHEVTRTTASAAVVSDIAPLPEVKTVVISGNGGEGDLRSDAAALVGYLAGRLALGAEELPR
ncbi:MAG: ABC transporter permease subunit [Chloroflexota bacterium]|nr:ABC transporter permease subunit [Chloroflexota bacterium]